MKGSPENQDLRAAFRRRLAANWKCIAARLHCPDLNALHQMRRKVFSIMSNLASESPAVSDMLPSPAAYISLQVRIKRRLRLETTQFVANAALEAHIEHRHNRPCGVQELDQFAERERGIGGAGRRSDEGIAFVLIDRTLRVIPPGSGARSDGRLHHLAGQLRCVPSALLRELWL
jgi:hypothetical protein